ncbi:MAG: PDZ domain-containing protein [Chloroflexi bacterium]|nr:PDZ domain-containing protein [Chloroflexota bacterium]
MNRSADARGRGPVWRGRALAAALLLGVIAVVVALAPSTVLAPLYGDDAPAVAAKETATQTSTPAAASAVTPTAVTPVDEATERPVVADARGAPAVSVTAPGSASSNPELAQGAASKQPSVQAAAASDARTRASTTQAPAARQAGATTNDPEPGLALIAAAYNAIEDRFFRPVDSKKLLGAAWDGARRGLTEQRRSAGSVAPPELTGDRTGDLAAFQQQYRVLIGAAGDVDANRIAMLATDALADSLAEQHTVFLPPDAFARFRAGLTSEQGRVGLGIVIQGQAAPFTITQVVTGAPADKAGVLAGDLIAAVDGQDVSSLDLRELSDLLRGDAGQPVTLTLQRGVSAAQTPAPATSGDQAGLVDVTVIRARFSEPPLTMRVLPEGVCYLHLSAFPVSFIVGPTGRTIGQDMDYYLEQCEQAGAKGWIMDLRGNGGGNALAEVLGRFMNQGPILVERDREGGRYEQATDGHLFRVQRPLVVLIDSGSASASEAFASAIQEYHRGVVMGQRSAGALNTANIIELPLDAGMEVAIREVFTGIQEKVVDGVGVTPDVALRFDRGSSTIPQEAIDAALNPPAGVGPLPEGPSQTEGVLSDDELRTRIDPVQLQASDAEQPENQVIRGEMLVDTLNYYVSDFPSLTAARERALRLGWQGGLVRWLGKGFPPPFALSVQIYRDADGAHKDLNEIYEPGEPQNPKQYRIVDSPVQLGDETLAQIGTGTNDGRIWIAWRRNNAVYVVSQTLPPGAAPIFDSVARLATIVDARAQQHAP